MSSLPTVTVVVTPRERFSTTRRTFEALAANTPTGQRVVYVAGGAPGPIRQFLTEACARHGYELILRPDFLAPNVARNLGLARADTEYVVFLDNDVLVEPGWVGALVGCAEEQRADLVSPLCLIGEAAEQNLHSLGGVLEIDDRNGATRLREHHHIGPICLRTSPRHLTRMASDYSEFHCALVRRSVFSRIGPFDEEVKGAAEHIDLALHLRAIGARGFAEPNAVVCYLPVEYTLGDLAPYAIRWSADWHFPTMRHLIEKWKLSPDSQFFADYLSDFHAKRERCLLRLDRGSRPAPVPDIAQTIVQLLQQMAAIGYEREALSKVHDAYMVATQLVADCFRGSGRPFVDHLVGTASILASYGANPAVLAACLHHTTYAFGRFPDDVRGIAAMRRWLHRRVGGAVEEIAFAYARLDQVTVDEHSLDGIPIITANAILIRIANAIEDRGGDHRCFDSADWLKQSNERVRHLLPQFAIVADRLGFGALTATLRDVCAQAEADQSNAAIKRGGPLNFTIDPRSREIVPLVARQIAHGDVREAPPVAPAHTANNLDVQAIIAQNGGRVTAVPEGSRLEAAATPWSYSALLRPALADLTGRAVINVELQVERGQIGALVLERGSSVLLVAPEQSALAGEAATLRFDIPAIEEVGDLVFRGWPHPDGAAIARIFAITLLMERDAKSIGDSVTSTDAVASIRRAALEAR